MTLWTLRTKFVFREFSGTQFPKVPDAVGPFDQQRVHCTVYTCGQRARTARTSRDLSELDVRGVNMLGVAVATVPGTSAHVMPSLAGGCGTPECRGTAACGQEGRAGGKSSVTSCRAGTKYLILAERWLLFEFRQEVSYEV